MSKSILIAVILAVAGALSLPAVAASGSCGKGKVWDADSQKCVKKPSGGSGSHGF